VHLGAVRRTWGGEEAATGQDHRAADDEAEALGDQYRDEADEIAEDACRGDARAAAVLRWTPPSPPASSVG
jgi:hypothetical protein